MNPENKKQVLIITLALGAGIVATVMTAGYVQSRIEGERAIMTQQLNKKQQEFVVDQQKSQQQIDALVGQINTLTQQQEQIKQQAIAAAQAAAQAAAPKAAAQSAGQEKVRKPSLALRTPPGKRAVTVMIDSLSAVGGLVDPGDFVDVIAQLNVPGKSVAKDKEKEKKEPVTVMIFQHLQILAINTNLDDKGIYDEQQAASALKVTFAVEPQEAGLMSFAEKNGKLQLALRSPMEQNNEKLKTSTWKTLADYVLQTHGENIGLKGQDEDTDTDEKKAKVESVDVKEAKPYIQIYRAGKEL
jgi:Flp pilus assembly protein CpaB